jgi:DNA-binding NarL/FixJ family response regulator
MLLETQPSLRLVGEAGTCAVALELAAREQPDIILLDLDLGGSRSTDCLQELLTVATAARVIILTGVRDSQLHKQAVHLGAVGLVLKEHAAETLLKAIERVHAGEVWLDRTMIANVLSHMTRATTSVDPEVAKIALLTDREREVIALLGEGLKNKQIAERLFISEATVRHHLTSVFGKLEVADRLELVIYAYRHNLIHLRPLGNSSSS